MNEIEVLRGQGCRGFVTVEKLMCNISVVPKESGVYFILRTSSEAPSFLFGAKISLWRDIAKYFMK